MKLIYIFWILILLSLTSYGQNVGIGTSSPNAILDVSATNNGILIPRVALTATNNASPLTSPAVSTLVYNTATIVSGATSVSPGFYYWNGSAWVRVIDNSSLTGATTVGNTSSANTLSTTVNGVTGSTVPIVNSISNTSSANTLSTTVNGVTGTGVPIINSNTLGLSGNTLTSTVNGIAPTQSLSGLSLSGDVTGTLANSTVGKIQGIGVAFSSLSTNNLFQYNGTNWVNVTPASVLGAATTNALSLSTNTLTSTVNGIAATSSAVSGVSNTSSANTLSTTVNGVTGTGVNIINSNALGLSGTTLTSTINGIASGGLNLSSIDNNIYNSDGTLTGNRTVTMGADNLTFSSSTGNLIFNPSSGGNVGIGTASPGVNRVYAYNVNAPSATSGNLTGARGEAFISANNYSNSTAIGVDAYAWAMGSSTGGTFTGDNLYGVRSIVYSAWGVVPSAYGLYAQAQVFQYQALTNYYGLYLDAENLNTYGVISNNYGVYQASTTAKNYFAGKVGIATTSPTATLSVNGTGYFSGAVGIGTASPGTQLDVVGVVRAGTAYNTGGFFTGDNMNAGSAHWGVEGTAYNALFTYGGMTVLGNTLNLGTLSVGMWTFAASPYAVDVAGQVRCTNGYWVASDARFKKDIKPIGSALSNLVKLQGVSYNWKTDEFKDLKFTNTLQYGVIAQELEKIFPDMVMTDTNGYKSVNYTMLTPVLVQAIKEQQQMIEGQQLAIDNLQAENKNLKSENDNMMKNMKAQIDLINERLNIKSEK